MSKLVIAEKPSVANSIADVLGAYEKEDGYREGNGYIVSWCVGHLVELAQPESYDEGFKKWSYDSLPIIPSQFQYEVKSDTKKQYGILKKLMAREDVESVVCATDAGREGELIFRLVFDQAKCNKPIERLWISSMEESAIRDGFKNLRPGHEYENLYQSALARQKADWLVGINGTRLFTVLYNGKVLKVGRVQTPTLAMLVDRETEIMNFKKEPFYIVEIKAGGLTATGVKIKDKDDADTITMSIKGKTAIIEDVQKEEKKANPPKLYDLTTLQRDANRIFGFTAKQTLEATQSLYEKKYVTYPRTDSQFLSDDMEQTARDVIVAIKDSMEFVAPSIKDDVPNVKAVMNSKKVTDHHAIIPTVEIAKGVKDVSDRELKVLHLIAARMLCATDEKHVYESELVKISALGNTFKVSNKVIKNNGWKSHEESLRQYHKGCIVEDNNEDSIAKTDITVKVGDTFIVEDAVTKEGFTSPPKHYTEDSLLKAMEKAGAKDMDDEVERKGLGTPATRADIIEKLVKDGFVKREKKAMIPTDDGMRLITILPDVVKSPQLTADWENELICVSKGETNVESFMDGIEKMVRDLVATYDSVSEENKNMFGSKKEILGQCPKCGNDVTVGKFGAYCIGKCGMTFAKAFGVKLTDAQVKNLLQNKKILVKGLTGKKGKYDAYLSPKGVKPYSYENKDGKEISGYQYDFEMSFPNKK